MSNNYNTEDNTGKKIGGVIIGAAAILVVGAAALYLVDVDQTKEARLPDIDVAVQEGQMPAFDVDVAEVKVGTKKTSMTVPDVDVKTKTVEVEVPVEAEIEGKEVGITLPTIDVEKPAEDSPDDDAN